MEQGRNRVKRCHWERGCAGEQGRRAVNTGGLPTLYLLLLSHVFSSKHAKLSTPVWVLRHCNVDTAHEMMRACRSGMAKGEVLERWGAVAEIHN